MRARKKKAVGTGVGDEDRLLPSRRAPFHKLDSLLLLREKPIRLCMCR
jgi:hypothetical protein